MEVPAQRSGAMQCTCTQYEQSMYYNYTQHRVHGHIHRTSHGEQYIYCPPTLLSNMNGYAMSIVLFSVAIKFVSHIRIRAMGIVCAVMLIGAVMIMIHIIWLGSYFFWGQESWQKKVGPGSNKWTSIHISIIGNVGNYSFTFVHAI